MNNKNNKMNRNMGRKYSGMVESNKDKRERERVMMH